MRPRPLVAAGVAALVAAALLGLFAIGGVHRFVALDAATVAGILAEGDAGLRPGGPEPAPAPGPAGRRVGESPTAPPTPQTPATTVGPRRERATPPATLRPADARTTPVPTVEGLLALTFPRPAGDPGFRRLPDPVPTPLARGLSDRLDRIATAPGLRPDAPYGVAVTDRWGRDVFTLDARRPVVPASTNKLVVAAAALGVLGPDLRLRTAVAATAAPNRDGVVPGDLVLVGGGDPALSSDRFATDVYPDRPHTPITALADRIAQAGVTAVRGSVLADPRLFAAEPVPEGWPDSYLDRMQGTRTSALTVDMGRRLVVRERDGALLGVSADDPALEAAAVLTAALAERDIAVDGEPALLSAEPPGAQLVAAVDSPPLGDLLEHMVTHSDNHMADTLFRLIGAVQGEDSWAGSERAVRRALDHLRLDWSGVVLRDGSGLSRANRLTAAFLTDLDGEMMATTSAGRWQALMAVAGESGTLRSRYRGSPAAGAVFAKTGALRDARALAGHVEGDDDGRYSFAVVGSTLDGDDVVRLRRLMDLVVLALAGEVVGCGDWTPVPPTADGDATTEPRQPPPEAAVCPAADAA